MPDKQTIHFYDTEAERYANITASDKPGTDLRAFMALLPTGAQVLDLGCGPARASVHLRDAGFKPDPVDASIGMIELANTAHDIGARVLTFDELDMVEAYDGVWANFSLLHASIEALPRHLAAIATALRPNGVFHIGMKLGEGAGRDAIERLYTYVSVEQLQELLDVADFDVLDQRQGREKGCAGTIDPFVIMRARKRA
jgi:SAM-dependent methyltransferase